MNHTIEEGFGVPFLSLPDLVSEKVGGRALAASDEFFAEKENLLKPGRGIFIPDKFTENGKWMDGWESRRKRTAGHDWCLLQLGMPGVLRGVNVDTNHFVGNYPEFCSLEAASAEASATVAQLESAKWTEIVPKQRLKGGSQNLFPVTSAERWTHLRLRIFPDGGVARFRAHGEVRPDWKKLGQSAEPVDLAALEHGGTVVGCNDNFFGPKDNLILPGRAATMGEGWETRRKRGPGHDWIIVRLGTPGSVKKIEVDTNHFKGNFPHSCSLEGASIAGNPAVEDIVRDPAVSWTEILPKVKLEAHARHYYEKELKPAPAVTHVRLNIYPDGGVSRLRVFAVMARADRP